MAAQAPSQSAMSPHPSTLLETLLMEHLSAVPRQFNG